LRETIYTIPLTDALTEGRCPFCYLHRRTEEQLLHLYLEGGVMEPDWRGRLLEKGLCGPHLERLFQGSPQLGMAILAKSLVDQADETLAANGKRRRPEPHQDTCLACDDLEAAFHHYAESFLLTYRKETDFRERVRQSAFCLPHLWQLIRHMAQKPWRDGELEKELIHTARTYLGTVQTDLNWFIQKFDYRFDQEPWNGAEDALERALRLLGGPDGNF
jgi:hypothetical protein